MPATPSPRHLRLAALALLGLATTAGAQDGAQARIDISGTELTAGITDAGTTVASEGGKLRFQMPIEAGQWKPMVLRFTAAKEGTVEISLRGEYRKTGEVWVYYDAIEAAGTTVINADFEDGSGSAAPASWEAKKGQHPERVEDAAIVKAGKACVVVSHGNRLAQPIPVKAGQEVVLTVQARLDKVTP